MSGGAIKKLRRQKIKQQLKEQREAKVVDNEAKVIADAILSLNKEDLDSLNNLLKEEDDLNNEE